MTEPENLFVAKAENLPGTMGAHAAMVFVIPEYQRSYDWKIDNIKRLLEDYLSGFDNCWRTKDSTSYTFLGTIILVNEKQAKEHCFPFTDDGIVKADVFRILEDSIGVPEYYQWRSRSGCYFCFFQRQDELIGLADTHPELFARAKRYEKVDPNSGRQLTWVQGRTLDDVLAHRKDIEAANANRRKGSPRNWQDNILDEDADDQACLICTL